MSTRSAPIAIALFFGLVVPCNATTVFRQYAMKEYFIQWPDAVRELVPSLPHYDAVAGIGTAVVSIGTSSTRTDFLSVLIETPIVGCYKGERLTARLGFKGMPLTGR